MSDDDPEGADSAQSFAEQVEAVREAFAAEDRTVEPGTGMRPDPATLLEALSGGTREPEQPSGVDLAPLVRELQHLRDEVTRIGVALEELVEQGRD
jgi:hypothetical protein